MRTSKYFIFFTIILLLQNCSQTRKGSIGQTYQNFNSRYNTYFNSKEKFALSYHAVKQNHIDNYDAILPIYELDNSNEAFTGQADLNVIEEKVGKLVAKYPASRWSDNGLLLVGKARYYKGEYAKAIKCLEYITSEYKKGFKTEELKKPGGKPTKKEKEIKEAEKKQIPIEEGSFEHTPSKNDALIFLAKSYTKLEKYAEAQSIISYAESDMTFPKEKRLELKKLQAFLYLEKKDYNGAEQSLKALLKEKKQKKLKARASFILGQIFELNKKPDSAYKFFEFVLENRPNDLMEFNAKLHMARMAGSSSGDAEKLLVKMSKEGKNEDYLDVIFYELGELKRKKGEDELAVNFYLKAISKTKENKHQQALSFIRLGEMQYDKEQYSEAYPFYDSSISRYNTKLKTFEFIKRRTGVLKDISENESIVYREDSLQALAKLGKEEAKKAIKAQLKAQMKLSKKEEEEREFLASKPSNSATTSGSEDWYFGNAAMMQSGLAEFKKIWKDRKLEDDWRRSGKTSNQEKGEPEDPTIKKKSGQETPTLTLDESADKNLELIPFEVSQINASNEKIIEAMYVLGNQFKDGVENYPKAIQTFEELNRRFPKNKYVVESLFNLYLIYGLQKDEANKAKYKNLILTKYSDHKLAEALRNPDGMKKLIKEAEKEDDYYAATYELFQTEQYDSTIANCIAYPSLYPKEKFKEKIKLLKSMSYGRKYDYKEFIASMNELANKSPDDAVKKIAKVQLEKFLNSDLPRIKTDTTPADSNKIIYNLTEDKLAVIGQPKDSARAIIPPSTPIVLPKDTVKSPYNFDFSASHSYIIVLDQEVSSSNIINGISNYNTKSFSTLNLKITPITMSNKTILMIQSFTDGSKASFYDKFLKNEKSIFESLKQDSYSLYSISNANLTILITTKNLNGYSKFYQENYK